VFWLSGLYESIIEVYKKQNLKCLKNSACRSGHSMFAHKFLKKKRSFDVASVKKIKNVPLIVIC
jgi:hypothetical protein